MTATLLRLQWRARAGISAVVRSGRIAIFLTCSASHSNQSQQFKAADVEETLALGTDRELHSGNSGLGC